MRRVKWIRGLLTAVTFVALAVYLTGCAAVVLGTAAGAGAAGVLWVQGKLVEDIEKPLLEIHEAAVQSLKDLGLPLKKDRHDVMTARMESVFVDGKRVWIDLDSLGQNLTRLKVRVGFGDQNRSERILAKIHQHLGK